MICTKCGTTVPEVELDECVGCGGALRPSAEELLRYPKFGLVREVRPPQIQMAKLIEEALASADHEEVVVEGGCGVGKTFAYLTPALRSDSRIVISTGNKMLQDQLYEKDIPTLLKVMGLDNLKLFINLKGKNNYICKKRLRAQRQKFRRKGMVEVWDRIMAWAEQDPVGDIKGFPGLESFDTHPLYLTRVDDCEKKHCKHHTECGYYNTKQKAKDANVLLINHYLLGWDLRLKNGLIFDHYDWLIVDEAHGAPDAIRSAFSKSISQKWLSKFLEELSGEQVDLVQIKPGELLAYWNGMFESVQRSRDPSDRVLEAGFFGNAVYGVTDGLWELYGDVASYVQGRWADRDSEFVTPEMFLTRRTEVWQAFQDYLMWVDGKLYRRKDQGPSEMEEYRTFGAVARLMDRLVAMIEDLTATTDEEDENIVWSHEFRKDNVTVKGEPINLGPLVSDELKSKHKLVFTSATLHEDYLAKELGLSPTRTQRWPAPFDFKSNARLYLPTHLAAPGGQQYHADLAQEINQLVDLSEGRALVLFSAKKDMSAVLEIIENEYDFAFDIIAQVDGESASSVTERFMHGIKVGDEPVIFGLKSFFEGFDVKGQDIQLVIITKIPFQDFKAPLNVGKKRLLGGKHWNDYYFPTMQNHIRQATGRLIRSQIDKGVVAILDTRMWIGGLGKKGVTPEHIVQPGDASGTMQQWAASDSGWPGNYGYKIFKSLPFDNCTFEIEDVAAFFEQIKQ
jgi:ATP-dependent DNA helicase DinG